MRDRSLYESTWVGPSDEERRLLAIASEYHTRCDSFDDVHLTGCSKSDESMPATSEQFVATNRNAAKVQRDLFERHGLTLDQWKQARRLYEIYRGRP